MKLLLVAWLVAGSAFKAFGEKIVNHVPEVGVSSDQKRVGQTKQQEFITTTFPCPLLSVNQMDNIVQKQDPESEINQPRDQPEVLNNEPVLVSYAPKLGQTFDQHPNAPKTKLQDLYPLIPTSFQFKPIILAPDHFTSENIQQEFEKTQFTQKSKLPHHQQSINSRESSFSGSTNPNLQLAKLTFTSGEKIHISISKTSPIESKIDVFHNLMKRNIENGKLF